MKKSLFILSSFLLFQGCQKDDPDPALISSNPTEALLVFPYENSECNEGTNITANESNVLFEWKAGENTDEYDLVVTNLSSNETATYTTSDYSYAVTLQRGTPYGWHIISRSSANDSTARSESWKFYNAGVAIENYAPFPAEIISPGMAESISAPNGEVTLNWSGSDVDNDIFGYDVFFGTTNPPDIFANGLQEDVLTGVPVESDSIYYWNVITKDQRGNSSESEIIQFKVL